MQTFAKKKNLLLTIGVGYARGCWRIPNETGTAGRGANVGTLLTQLHSRSGGRGRQREKDPHTEREKEKEKEKEKERERKIDR